MDNLWKQSGRELSKDIFFIISQTVTQTWIETRRLPEECTPLAPTPGSPTVKKENSKIQLYLNSFLAETSSLAFMEEIFLNEHINIFSLVSLRENVTYCL